MPPPLPVDALSTNARILSASFLESLNNSKSNSSSSSKNKKKKKSSGSSSKEAVRRLAKIVEVLQEDETIDPSRPDEWPGLSELADLMVQNSNSNDNNNNNSSYGFLNSTHKEVRLYTVLVCLELLGIYAPDIPGHWTTPQLLAIFDQSLQQVSNLSHCYSPTDRHYTQYVRILDLFAEVKMGVVLVELVMDNNSNGSTTTTTTKALRDEIESNDDFSDSDNDSDIISKHHKLATAAAASGGNGGGEFSSTPQEVLAAFFQTLLGCVRREHSTQIRDQVVEALAACLEEFDCSARLDTSLVVDISGLNDSMNSTGSGGSNNSTNIPIRIIDEILLCLGPGPTVEVKAMTAVVAAAAPEEDEPEESNTTNKKKRNSKRSSKKSKEKATAAAAAAAAAPKAQLTVKREENPTYMAAAALLQKTANKTATPISALLNALLNGDATTHSSATATDSGTTVLQLSSIQSDPDLAFCDTKDDVWTICSQVHRVCPPLLTTVIGNVAAGNGLFSQQANRRLAAVQLLGQLFARKQHYHGMSNTTSMAQQYHSVFLEWLGRQADIDVEIRKTMVTKLLPILNELANSGSGVHRHHGSDNTLQMAVECLQKFCRSDPDPQVRLLCISQICDFAYKKGSASTSAWLAPLLKAVASRVSAKLKQERKEAVSWLARVYWKQYMMEHVLCDVRLVRLAADATTTTTAARTKRATSTQDTMDDDDDDDDFEDYEKIVSPESLDVILRVLNEKCHLHKQRKRRQRQSSVLLTAATPASKKKRRRRNRGDNDDDDDDYDDDDALDAFFDEDDSEEALYAWIPKAIFSAASFSDQMDADMRSRVIKIIDEVLLGTDQFQDKTLSPLARAVGLTVILHSLRQDDGENLLVETTTTSAATAASSSAAMITSGSNVNNVRSVPFKFMLQLMNQRALLQRTLAQYMEARLKVREYKQGTEEALAADATAMEILQTVAKLTAPVVGHGVSQSEVLQIFHEARDKRVFRTLATITQPTHSHSARMRAVEDLPKRTHALGEAVSTWVKSLVRRCAMGYFINADIVHHSVLLARESYLEHDIPACASLLVCAKTASTEFPALCGTEKTFRALTELFSDCRATEDPKINKEMKEAGIITALSSILSASAPSANPAGGCPEHHGAMSSDSFQTQLVQLCTRDGTPEQARNAVYTLAGTANAGIESGGSQQSHHDIFSELLKTLTCSSRLTLLPGEQDPAIVSALTSLSAIADCQPQTVGNSRMKKATTFALETILMGRGGEDTSDAEDEVDDTKVGSQKKKARHSRRQKHSSPNGAATLLEDEDLSIACRRLCAAIDFLVSHVRSSILNGRGSSGGNKKDPFSLIPKEHASQIFDLLTQILRDKGLPPSNRDRRLCKSRQDRAALRQSAAVHLFRLCDSRLGIEKALLTNKMWHHFSASLLDEERVVRSAVMEEFSHFLKGSSAYGMQGSKFASQPPALRFVAFLAFCTDGDHGHDRDAANGFAANVGKGLAVVRNAALQCVVDLRKVCDATYTQCRMMGPQSEKQYETFFKLQLMPEYVVPFAFHLLIHRRETISAAAPASLNEEDEMSSDEEDEAAAKTEIEKKNRILRKRLKSLFEPLVSSLGDSADNISFLLSMAELMGKNFVPVDASEGITEATETRNRGKNLEASLTLVSDEAREVLISLVKKDVNLSTDYPGNIQIPQPLFAPKSQKQPGRKRKASGSVKSRASRKRAPSKGPQGMDIAVTKRSSVQTTPTAEKKQPETHRSSLKKRPVQESAFKSPVTRSSPAARVHFSPDLQLPVRNQASSAALGENATSTFGDMSPIDKFSPSAPEQRSRILAASASVATQGTTPPAPMGTIQSTAQTDCTDEESVDSSRPCEQIVESEVKLSLSSELGLSMSDEEGDDQDGTGTKTTTEAQSSISSRPSRTQDRKRKSQSLDKDKADADDDDNDAAEKPKRKRASVPKQIKVKDKYRAKENRDKGRGFGDTQSSENKQNASTKKIGASDKRAERGKSASSETKNSSRRRIRHRLG